MVGALRVQFIAWTTLLLLLLFCGGASGSAGDCNGSGNCDISDAVVLIDYLWGEAPPASYADCDCDGLPGVNFGDVQQILASIFSGAALFPSPGIDLITPANTSIMISGKVNGTTLTKTHIFINNPSALAGGFTLPFSFAASPGQADLNCTNVTMGPKFASDSYIDNVGKTLGLICNGTVAATTNWEVLCEIDFIPDPQGSPGTAITIKPTIVARYFPLLLSTKAYDGTNFVRMLFPRFVPDTLGMIGDANCDGTVDIADVVYVFNHIFKDGNPPGDPDGDGTPDCPGN